MSNRPSLIGSIGRAIRAWYYFREGSNITGNRSYQPVRAQDADKTDIPWVRTSLLSHARRAVANMGFARGAVKDCQMFTLGPTGLRPKSLSANTDWGKQADAWFAEWSKICEVTGRYNFKDGQYLALGGVLVDGDWGAARVKTATQFPKLQFIEGHQIGNGLGLTPSTGTPNDTNPLDLIDGVWVNRVGRPVKYRILTTSGSPEGEEFNDIDAANFIHVFEPERCTGHRGISAFGAVINHMRDIEDWLASAKKQHKHDASLIGVRKMISGTVGQTAWDAALNANNSATDYTLEQIIDGNIPTVRPGEGYEFYNTTRPSQQAMNFVDYLESDVLLALGLPANWKQMHKEGGATLRLAALRAQYRFITLQNLIIEKFCMPVHHWAVAVAAKRGDIPPLPDDWWRVKWKGPAVLTADAMKVNKENREDIFAGLRSPIVDAEDSGDDHEAIQRDILEVTRRRCKEAAQLSVDFPWLRETDAMHLLEKRDINRTTTAQQPDPQD